MRTILFISLFFLLQNVHADIIKIGVRAHSGEQRAIEQWQKTADYLSSKIPEHQFIIVPVLSLQELLDAVGRGELDFILTNPSSSVEMHILHGSSQMVTLNNLRQGKPYNQFGSVIFTLANRDDINQLDDLKGKKFIAVSEQAFGGWRVARLELLHNNIIPQRDFKELSFSGGIQESVVHAVLSKKYDAGVVRTDMLERMAQRGEIDLNYIKVINQKQTPGFPFFHSTDLYPEWAFNKAQHIPTNLAQRVALALLSMPSNNPAAISGQYAGWTVVSDYEPVRRLMQELKVGPYINFGEMSFTKILAAYKIWIIGIILLSTTLIFITSYVVSINRQLELEKNKQIMANANLERRVEERTSELLMAKQVAEKANSAKTEFLSRVSHELRTPMNAILGFSQVLLIDDDDPLTESQHDSLSEIKKAGDHLLLLIEDILDLSKIESDKFSLDFELIDINEIVTECINLLSKTANDKNIILHKEVPDNFIIQSNRRALKQIIINLLSNAIKYSGDNSRVSFICHDKSLYPDIIKIQVIDNGPGIPDDQKQYIFDPFKRLNRDLHVEGTGIGLALVQKLISGLNGSIDVVNNPMGGACFNIEFPKQ